MFGARERSVFSSSDTRGVAVGSNDPCMHKWRVPRAATIALYVARRVTRPAPRPFTLDETRETSTRVESRASARARKNF